MDKNAQYLLEISIKILGAEIYLALNNPYRVIKECIEKIKKVNKETEKHE